MVSVGRRKGDSTVGQEKNPVDEIIENLAGVAANAGNRSFTAKLEDVLQALFADTGIPAEELRADLMHRTKRQRL
jgi:hypothetical protein